MALFRRSISTKDHDVMKGMKPLSRIRLYIARTKILLDNTSNVEEIKEFIREHVEQHAYDKPVGLQFAITLRVTQSRQRQFDMSQVTSWAATTSEVMVVGYDHFLYKDEKKEEFAITFFYRKVAHPAPRPRKESKKKGSAR